MVENNVFEIFRGDIFEGGVLYERKLRNTVLEDCTRHIPGGTTFRSNFFFADT
jgi:hypothetical protein